MKFEPKDYIALVAALFTVGSVVWKGGQISAQLDATNDAVRAIVPVVSRLDVLTGRLEAITQANSARIDEHGRRIDHMEELFTREKR